MVAQVHGLSESEAVICRLVPLEGISIGVKCLERFSILLGTLPSHMPVTKKRVNASNVAIAMWGATTLPKLLC